MSSFVQVLRRGPHPQYGCLFANTTALVLCFLGVLSFSTECGCGFVAGCLPVSERDACRRLSHAEALLQAG